MCTFHSSKYRLSGNYIRSLPSPKTATYGLQFMLYLSVKLWNSLSNSVRASANKNFVNTIKQWNVSECLFCVTAYILVEWIPYVFLPTSLPLVPPHHIISATCFFSWNSYLWKRSLITLCIFNYKFHLLSSYFRTSQNKGFRKWYLQNLLMTIWRRTEVCA